MSLLFKRLDIFNEIKAEFTILKTDFTRGGLKSQFGLLRFDGQQEVALLAVVPFG
jgi:hypothetical protein